MADVKRDCVQADIRSFQVGCTLNYDVNEESAFIFNVMPAQSGIQHVDGELMLAVPDIPLDEYVELGTGNRYQRLCCPRQTQLSVQFNASVRSTTPPRNLQDERLADPPSSLPFHTLTYLFPSRYCQSDQLLRLAHREFGGFPRGLSQVETICTWVQDNVEYLPGSTGSMTTAFDTVVSRAGVCRDFTHLAIALCCAVGIPARFVSGYAIGLDPPDFHALLEVWIGDRWYLLDPTHKVAPQQFVRIGTGRDAGEVSFAFIFGEAYMVDMNVYCLEPDTLSEENGSSQPNTSPSVLG